MAEPTIKAKIVIDTSSLKGLAGGVGRAPGGGRAPAAGGPRDGGPDFKSIATELAGNSKTFKRATRQLSGVSKSFGKVAGLFGRGAGQAVGGVAGRVAGVGVGAAAGGAAAGGGAVAGAGGAGLSACWQAVRTSNVAMRVRSVRFMRLLR